MKDNLIIIIKTVLDNQLQILEESVEDITQVNHHLILKAQLIQKIINLSLLSIAREQLIMDMIIL